MTYQPPDPGIASQDASGAPYAPPPGAYGYQPYPQGYPPGYPPQAYSGYPGPAGTNGFAIASLVLGILWLYGIGSLLALIFGLVARRQIRERNQGGDGMAIAGVVLGIIGLAGFVVIVLVILTGVTTASG